MPPRPRVGTAPHRRRRRQAPPLRRCRARSVRRCMRGECCTNRGGGPPRAERLGRAKGKPGCAGAGERWVYGLIMAADAQASGTAAIVRSEREGPCCGRRPGRDRARALKAYQQQRFSRTYADLLASSRYAAASRFFLDTCTAWDFGDRDAQFARVVPAGAPLPAGTGWRRWPCWRGCTRVESLDSTMGRHLPAG